MMDTIHIVTSTSVQARRNTLSFLGSGLFVPTSVKINYNLTKRLLYESSIEKQCRKTARGCDALLLVGPSADAGASTATDGER